MSTPNKEKNVKYYNPNEVSPNEVMEDYFASEEEEELNASLEEGWKVMGVYDPNNPADDERFLKDCMDNYNENE